MHIPIAHLISLCLITLHFGALKAQYDDDTTPRKVQLEDLENEHDHRKYAEQAQIQQLQQLQQQRQPLPTNHQQFLRRPTPLPPPLQAPNFYEAPNRQHIATHKPTAHAYEPPLSATHAPTAAAPSPTASANYAAESANRYSFGVNPYTQSQSQSQLDDERDVDDVRGAQQQHELLSQAQRQQLSSGYDLKENPATYLLVPPYANDDNSAEHNQLTAPVPLLAPHRRPTAPVYLHTNNADIPTITPPPPTAASNIAALQYVPAGVRYLPNNDLGDAPADSIIYAREPLLQQQRPTFNYGSPLPPFLRPTYAQQLREHQAQSNQLAYAPPRPDSYNFRPTIPYPPSFISITTRRPHTTAGYSPDSPDIRPPPLVGRGSYGRQFRPSQRDPLPDLFANRHTKSLLDSYIPSWVVAQMLEQQRAGPVGGGYHTLAYATPYYNHYYKRESPIALSKSESGGERKIVKKSLDVQLRAGKEKKVTEEKEEMLMTA